SRGDHMVFGDQVHAGIVGVGWGLLLISAYFQRFHHWQAGFPPKSRIYVDQNGRRFMDEDASYAVASGIFADRGGWAWCIFDETARLSLDSGYADWTPERIEGEALAGGVRRAESIGALACSIGVDEQCLQSTVSKWNSHLPQGSDPQYFRDRTLRSHGQDPRCAAIAQPPYYGLKVHPGELVCTHAGLEIDPAARVLSCCGEPIPGLFAAGESGGGILGPRYIGGGNGVANALTMGRVAGRNALRYSRSKEKGLSFGRYNGEQNRR
ncbi:MAG: FAD-binding protein, partial [Actinobacteria bacterium]|nr:FAD-binding protein [Actinomycetota bacterium]